MKTGLGIRPELFAPVIEQSPELGFLEAHSENYFGDSIARHKLLALRQDYPVTLHGVGLSLGRADGLDLAHLKQLKQLVDEVEPLLVSEHLAWSAYAHTHLPDLLPLPLHDESLTIICQHIEQMQDYLQRQVLLENPSNYLAFEKMQISEPEFLNTVAQQTGCGLLVDINNIYVSSHNLERDAEEYLAQLNTDTIRQYHLAGHTPVQRGGDEVLIDTHNQLVRDEVWQLYSQAVIQHGHQPTLLEWDSDFPEFEVLLAECERADVVKEKTIGEVATAQEYQPSENTAEASLNLDQLQNEFLGDVLSGANAFSQAVEQHQSRIWIYQNNVYSAVLDYLQEVYPALNGVVGDKFFKQMVQSFVQRQPPSAGNINLYGEAFKHELNEFESLADLPYLGDLMDYEWALHTAYFASVNEVLDPSQYEQQQLLSLSVGFNPSVTVIESKFPLYEIHRQSLPTYNQLVEINLEQSSDTILVHKQAHRVETRVLSTAENQFLQELNLAPNLLQAIEAVSGSIDAKLLSAILSMVLQMGLLMAVDNKH